MMQRVVTNASIIRLLKKYGLILIVYEATIQYGLIFITRYYFKTFYHDPLSNLNDISYLLNTGTVLACNILIGLIILFDLNQTVDLDTFRFNSFCTVDQFGFDIDMESSGREK